MSTSRRTSIQKTRFSETEMATTLWSLGDSNRLRRFRVLRSSIGRSSVVGEFKRAALGGCLQSPGPGARLQGVTHALA